MRKTANVESMQSCVVKSHYVDKAIASDAFGLGSKPVVFTSEPYKHNVVYKVPAKWFWTSYKKKSDPLSFEKLKCERFYQMLPLVTSWCSKEPLD